MENKSTLLSKTLVIGIIFLFIGINITPSSGKVIEKDFSTRLVIDGPTYGKLGVPYDYVFYLSNPNPEDKGFELDICWGGCYWLIPAGHYWVYQKAWFRHAFYSSHPWVYSEVFLIEARARCNGTTYSAELEVFMPRSRETNNLPFMGLLDRFPLLEVIILRAIHLLR